MHLKTLVAAASLACAATAASAASPFAPGSDLGFLDNANVSFFGNPATGSFNDAFTFSLANPGTSLGGVFSFDLGTFLNITGLNVSLSGGGFSASDSDLSDGFFFAGVPSGSFTFTVAGLANGLSGGAYQGSIGAVTSPVPEPAALVLALAGIGVLGLVRRRRFEDRA